MVGNSVRLTEFPANTPDAIQFKSQFQHVLLPIAQQYMDDMVERWQQSKLLSLLTVLNAFVVINSDVPSDDSEENAYALQGYLPSEMSEENALKGYVYRAEQDIDLDTITYHDVSKNYKHVYFIGNSKCIIVLSLAAEPSAVAGAMAKKADNEAMPEKAVAGAMPKKAAGTELGKRQRAGAD